MKNNRIRVAALAAVAAAAIAAPAIAGHSWNNYHWKRSLSGQVTAPVVTAISDAKWGAFVKNAVIDWNKSDYLESPAPAPAVGVNPKNCRAISGKILVCNARYGYTGWLGVAQIWLSSGHIVQGTTKLNDSYFDSATYNKDEWRAMVTCQEIGHDYGLGHQDETFDNPDLKDSRGVESCMDYTDTPLGNEHPNQHDYDQLTTIYGGHSEMSFQVVSPGQSNAGSGLNGAVGGDTPADWGRAVGYDGRGRPDTFVQDLGGGKRKVTHVFWADGEGPRS